MKYELIEEPGKKLKRIRYLIDIPSREIKKGDLGGLLQTYDNLSQFDNCVVLNEAKVFDNAKVIGNAIVKDEAELNYYSLACGNSIIKDNAKLLGNASSSGSAKIEGNAVLKDCAQVDRFAVVKGDADADGFATISGYDRVTSKVFNYHKVFRITYSLVDKFIRVGCKSHSFAFWENYVKTNKDTYLIECGDEINHEILKDEIRSILT